MTINLTHLLKAGLAMLTLGMFAITVAAPVTLDHGMLVQKSAYAKNGADDGPDAGDDNGGHGGDDAPDGTDGADDDGTADQGTGDN